MSIVLRLASYLGLALTILAPLLAWMGSLETGTSRAVLNVAMVLWFGTAILWIKHERPGE